MKKALRHFLADEKRTLTDLTTGTVTTTSVSFVIAVEAILLDHIPYS